MVLQRRPSRRGRHQSLHILTCFFVRLPTSVLCAFVMVDTAAHHSCQLPLQWIKSWRKISSWSGPERTRCKGSCRYLGSWQQSSQPLTYMWLSKDADLVLEWIADSDSLSCWQCSKVTQGILELAKWCSRAVERRCSLMHSPRKWTHRWSGTRWLHWRTPRRAAWCAQSEQMPSKAAIPCPHATILSWQSRGAAAESRWTIMRVVLITLVQLPVYWDRP